MLSKKTLAKRKRIINLYVIDKFSVKKISTLCDISASTVYCILKDSNVRMRKASDYNKRTPRKIERKLNREKYRNLLIYLYQILKLKRRDLALLFSTSLSKVDKLLKKYDLKRN